MRLTAFAAALAAAALACAGSARAFGFADARALVSLRQPQISPDGRWVVYVRSTADYAQDRNVAQLMLLDVRTRSSRPLTFDRKGVGSPVWAPDGSAIYFTALADGDDPQAQVFVLRMDGGDARQVTTAARGVDGFALSPDGTRIAYDTADPNPNQKQIDAHRDAFQVGDNDYLHTAATMPEHVWIASVAGGRASRLTSGGWSMATDPDGGGTMSWSPDGKTIAIVRYPTPYTGDSLGGRVVLVNAATGAMRPLTGNAGLESAASFAPRGDAIAYVRNTAGNPANGEAVYATHAAGSPGRDLRRAFDRNVDGAAWDVSGKAIYLQTPDRTSTALWYVTLDGRARRVATGGLEPAELGNVANDGALVYVASSWAHPPELYLLGGPAAAPVALTAANAAAARAPMGRSTGVTWTGPGGFDEDGVLTYPPGAVAGKKYPLVLVIHGGPQGASTLAWSSQRQLFASHGYAIFEPNYRGSTNLGDAYERAIARDAGDGPGKDVMAGVAAVEKLGIVDTSRIAVSGWSYGGFMTSWLIGHYHVWKTAVTGASLDDWFDDFNIAYYVYTDVPFFGGVPSDPKYTAMWRAQSPLTYATAVTTPTLILGDIGDNNVTITNSFKFYHALRDNGVPVTFVAYPVPGHHPSDPVRGEDITKRWVAWLDKYLK